MSSVFNLMMRWTSYARAHSVKKRQKFCMVIKLDVRKIFTVQGRPRMLTRDLFAVANFVLFVVFLVDFRFVFMR